MRAPRNLSGKTNFAETQWSRADKAKKLFWHTSARLAAVAKALVVFATSASLVLVAPGNMMLASAADDDLIWSAGAEDQPAQHFNVQVIADSLNPGTPPFGLNPFSTELSPENLQQVRSNVSTIAPLCTADTQVGCISSVKYALGASEMKSALSLASPGQRAFAWGRCTGATCDDLAFTSTYPADTKSGLMESGLPLLFDFPEAQHSRGTQYWVNANLRGVVDQNNNVIYSGVDFSVIATRIVTGKHNFDCWKNFVETKARADIGYCNYAVNPPLDLKVQIKLRLGSRIKDMSGWFDGRLNSAVIDFGKAEPGVVSVEGSPLVVPVAITNPIPFGDPLNNTDPAIDATRSVGTLGITDSRNGMGMYDRMKSVIADKAYRENAVWRLTMWTQDWGVSRCSNPSGVSGIMITNASAYDPGPPTWNTANRELQFRVAGNHLLSNSQLNSGYYNLLLDETVAKCLWGPAYVGAKATISVVEDSSTQEVATTVYQQKNGWVNFLAAGFHFSSPKINVGFELPAQPVKKTTITCVSLKNKKKIVKVTAIAPKCPAGFKKK